MSPTAWTRSRAPGRATSWLGSGVLVIAALAAGHAVTASYSSDSAITAPFLRSGVVGSTVHLRYADIRLVSVQGSSVVSSIGTLLATPGEFLVMRVEVVAKGEPRNLLYAAVTTPDGHIYQASPGGRSSFTFGNAQPGIAQYGTVSVELPISEVSGATLRIALNPDDQGRDDMTDIALGVTPAQAAAYAASKHAIVLLPASYSLHPEDGL